MTKEAPTQEEQLKILKEFHENPMGEHQGITGTHDEYLNNISGDG